MMLLRKCVKIHPHILKVLQMSKISTSHGELQGMSDMWKKLSKRPRSYGGRLWQRSKMHN